MASIVCRLSGLIALTTLLGVALDAGLGASFADPSRWRSEWPRTDFSKHSVALAIRAGRDVGNVVVKRRRGDRFVDIPYDVTFGFVFHAFRPGSPIHKDASDTQGAK